MTSHIGAKMIKSLRDKKYRKETGMFLVEGTKNVAELLRSDYVVEAIYVTKEFKGSYQTQMFDKGADVHLVDAAELTAYGTLEHNDGALAVARQKVETPIPTSGIILALDDIRDPGNLGTLIRIADWYGITDVVCSASCVDWHNPKVIAASMGSFTRVSGHYVEMAKFLKESKLPKLGAFLEGESAHQFAFPKDGILVIGSESHGISKDAAKQITQKVTIPSYGGAESLNAAIAGAILLDRWKGGSAKA